MIVLKSGELRSQRRCLRPFAKKVNAKMDSALTSHPEFLYTRTSHFTE